MKSKPFKPVLANLCAEAEQLGKPAWRPVLQYVAELHGRSILAPTPPFEHAWEEIGPGYCGSPCFGHWDIVHQILDTVPAEPVHARNQMLNNLASQLKNGFLPGTIWMRGGKPKFKTHAGHPPVWPFGAEQIFQRKRDLEFLRTCYDALLRQTLGIQGESLDEGGRTSPSQYSYEQLMALGETLHFTPKRREMPEGTTLLSEEMSQEEAVQALADAFNLLEAPEESDQ